MHCYHGLVFFESTTSNTPKFLHVRTTPKDVAQMDTEGSDVGASLALDPEDSHVSLLVVVEKLLLINSSHSQFLLYG